jgi:histidine ammonia-lyase
MSKTYIITPGKLFFKTICELINSDIQIALDTTCFAAIADSQKFVDTLVNTDQPVYGINTGVGLLANIHISENDLSNMQRNILLSHAAGVGENLPDEIVKLTLLLKINTLARGYSGVRPLLIETLMKFYNHGIYPCIPAKGSVGASGDLAPLAHLCLPLIGEGLVRHKNQIISAKEALKLIGIEEAITLAPKEGLALINGTQISTAIALYYLTKIQTLLSAAVAIGALTVDAALGSDTPFDEKIHEIRGQHGQIKVAATLRKLLAGSDIRHPLKKCKRVQDPYCLRCQPQVLGSSLDNLLHAETILTREANAVTDNPLIFTEDKEVLSGGNFHAEPVAQVADLMAIALAEIGALSERRIALLVDPQFNCGLPAFLIPNAGINSGFMVAHVTAAALASANKSLAHPASVDSLPTSANQEDFVSMATQAAWRLKEMHENVHNILSIELLAACQGIDLRYPLETSKPLQDILFELRQHVPFWQEDRFFAPDIQKSKLVVNAIGFRYIMRFFELT